MTQNKGNVNPKNGLILQQARTERGLSGEEMAEILEVSPRTLRAWENGEKHCPPGALKLALLELQELKEKFTRQRSS